MLPQQGGAFASLGALPRRTSTKRPTFHFNDDDGSSSPTPTAVPFPPLHSPPLTRSPSGVLKPLKSSLKSSLSSPNIPFPAQSLVPSIMFPDLHPKQQQHQRASSAPCSPLFPTSSSSSTSSSSNSSPTFHHAQKNVHFPSQEEGGLATIRVFNRSARPASLSRLGEETETTDTDGDVSSGGLYGSGGWPGWSGKYVGGSTFPFPRVPAEKKSPLNPSKQNKYNIDWSISSAIPRKNVDRRNENVFFESLHVVHADNDTALQGSILVRNITYQKTVMVRYTVDEWETVNDVLASYDGNGDGWDRFKFSVSFGGQRMQERVVWMVGKYAGGAADAESKDAVEWWDNNQGKNYRVAFKEDHDVYKRNVVVSAPMTYTSPRHISRQKLSDPQISSSIFAAQQYRHQQEREQHQAALTQTTLARLKKLNLKNYAAPRGYTQSFSATETPSPSSPKVTPPVLTLTSASPTTSSFARPSSHSPPPNLSLNTTLEISSPTLSTTTAGATSTDSTPVQTPVQEEEDGREERWIVGGEEEESLRWGLGMENGHFATTLTGMPSMSSPTTPVSIPGDRKSFSYSSGGVEMGTSPPFSDLKESVGGGGGRGGGSVYWDWGTAAGVALGGGGERKEEQSAYELTNGGGGTGLMPPQRRRALQQQKKRGSGTSSSSSGSDSNSKDSQLLSTLTTPIPTPPSTATSVTTPKQKAKPPILTLPTSTLTRPSVTSPSSVQSPNLSRGYNNNSPPPQRHHGHRHFQSIPSFIGNNTRLPSTTTTPGGDSDAIYQALVREWCFAQGPSTNSTCASGNTTPVLVVKNHPSPLGLTTCALGDGE